MHNIWITSDSHFNHNKEFVYKERGFSSVEEMNEAIIERWNECINPNDIVYHLGDVMMGDLNVGLPLVKSLNGHIKLALGNHDTPQRVAAFSEFFDEIQFGYRIKVGKKVIMLSHYPMLTGNYDESKTYSFHGHAHSKNISTPEYDLMFNVSLDAHDCYPWLLDNIMSYINSKSMIFNELAKPN